MENVELNRRGCDGIMGSNWLVIDSGEPENGMVNMELYCMRWLESRLGFWMKRIVEVETKDLVVRV